MLKQFNLAQQVFADPVLVVDEQGYPILNTTTEQIGEFQYTTSGEGWYAVESQDEIDRLSASLTGNGVIWVENGKLTCSGKRPNNQMKWDKDQKKWVMLDEQSLANKQAEMLERKRQSMLASLSTKTDQLKDAVLAGYPQTEIDSFYRQEREARAWIVDNTAQTPMLNSIAEKRDIPLAMLVEKVIEKADQLAVVIGNILGEKQRFEDRITAVKNLDEFSPIEQEIEQWQLSI